MLPGLSQRKTWRKSRFNVGTDEVEAVQADCSMGHSSSWVLGPSTFGPPRECKIGTIAPLCWICLTVRPSPPAHRVPPFPTQTPAVQTRVAFKRLPTASTLAITATTTLALQSSVPGADTVSNAATVADQDAVLDAFARAFSLPRQQLRMILERQPALQRADPQILAQRIDAYTRVTGLDAYQLLFMAARQPAFLSLSPAILKERCEALAKSLALSMDDLLRLVVSQPAFLEVQPDILSAVSGRVAGELGVRPGAALRVLARLPLGELRSVVSRQQPGLLRERLVALRYLLLRAFGPERASQEATLLLISRCPPLLALPTELVGTSLATLRSISPKSPKGGAAGAATTSAGTVDAATGSGGVEGATRSGRGRTSVFRAILSCPHILTLPPETIRERFAMLAAAAQIDMPAVVSMLLLQPRLLLVDPARVRQRLEALTFSLMVPRSAALDMVVRQPQLLLYNSETLAENWAVLLRVLSITFDAALSMVTRHPNLLCLSPAVLAAKLSSLETIFALPRSMAVMLVVQKPVLLVMSEKSYQAAHGVLAPLLALPSPSQLGKVVFREPYLLLEDPVKLTAKVSLAASLLDITEEEVGAMLARSASFITKDLSYWQTNLDTVTAALGLSLGRVRQVAVRYPYLMNAVPATLLRVVSSNMALIRSSPYWVRMLEMLDVDRLYTCVAGFNDRQREHLQYLVEVGLQSEVPFFASYIFHRETFAKRFPRFANWQAIRRTATTSPNGLPLTGGVPAWPPAMSMSSSTTDDGDIDAAASTPVSTSVDDHATASSSSSGPNSGAGIGGELEIGGTSSLVAWRANASQTNKDASLGEIHRNTASGHATSLGGRGKRLGQGARSATQRPMSRRQQVKRMPSLSRTDEQLPSAPQPRQ